MWLWLFACAGSADPPVHPPVVDAARLTIEGPAGALIAGVYNLGELDGAPGHELGLAVGRGEALTEGSDLYVFSGGQTGALRLEDADQVIVNDAGAWWIVDGGQCTPDSASGHRNAVGLGDLDGDGLGELMLAFGDDAGDQPRISFLRDLTKLGMPFPITGPETTPAVQAAKPREARRG